MHQVHGIDAIEHDPERITEFRHMRSSNHCRNERGMLPNPGRSILTSEEEADLADSLSKGLGQTDFVDRFSLRRGDFFST